LKPIHFTMLSYRDVLVGANALPTRVERDDNYRLRIKTAKKAVDDARRAMIETCLDCVKKEATIRGFSECFPHRAPFNSVCLVVPCKNGAANVAVQLDYDGCVYTAEEFHGHFMANSSWNKGMFALTTVWGDTPGELFDALLKSEAEYPVGVPLPVKKTCSLCEGTGTLVKDICTFCDGSGVISII